MRPQKLNLSFFRPWPQKCLKWAPDAQNEPGHTNASNGAVSYTFTTSDTDTAGLFQGEFQVTFSGGAIETFPNAEYISINILDDLD